MKAKLKTNVCCDVCHCVHNVNGCLCEKSGIEVSAGNEDNAHFCKTYCKK